ncbi:ribosomal protein S18-alanine N-acetyltransferase [Psychrobacter sp. I-STPA10]|uniref:ribosomal protein S18-alanine N-acetyltransferase n=1 Tax=Psychrobacter sp. I-STPA10 TaxID=2585769 RepID=UPI001E3F9EC3|nr:ribosomal protein S18-alanine N-acetyltransferase [Psychrobacter sp. I-STPA10]
MTEVLKENLNKNLNKTVSNQYAYQIIDKNNKNLTDITDTTDVIRQVADIESLVQSEDSWTQAVIAELLADKFNHLSVAITAHTSSQLKNTNQQKVVAYCLYNIVFEQAEILRIGTCPNYQRQGIAKGLLSQTLQDIKGQGTEGVLLEVRADNDAAIALYQQLGFKQIHRRIGYYQVPNDASHVNSHQNKLSQPVDALIMQCIF